MTVLAGLLAVAVGLVLCLRGAAVFRVLIAVWSGFVGFVLGGGVVAAVTDDTFLSGAVAIVVALGLATAFGLAAYLLYAVAVVVAMGAFGFTLGTDLLVALGVSWSWLVVLGGLAAGVVLAAVAVAGDLPMVVLAVLSALAGASTAVTGWMLVVGTIDLEALSTASTTEQVADAWWPWLLYAALAAAGLVVQLRWLDSWRRPVHDAWAAHPSTSGPSTSSSRTTPRSGP